MSRICLVKKFRIGLYMKVKAMEFHKQHFFIYVTLPFSLLVHVFMSKSYDCMYFCILYNLFTYNMVYQVNGCCTNFIQLMVSDGCKSSVIGFKLCTSLGRVGDLMLTMWYFVLKMRDWKDDNLEEFLESCRITLTIN